MKMKLNVYVVDDHKVFIEGITMMLKGVEEVHNVKGFTEVNEFYDEIIDNKNLGQSILLLDVNLDRLVNGIDICREVKKKAPEVKIIALTLHHEKRFVQGMIDAGCDSYLLKSNSFQEITKAIFEVSQGRKYFSEEVMATITKENEVKDIIYNLNPREKRVLEAVVKGIMNAEIAKSLKISIKTVEYYRKGLYIKFGVSNVVELTNVVNKNEVLL